MGFNHPLGKNSNSDCLQKLQHISSQQTTGFEALFMSVDQEWEELHARFYT